MAAKKPEEVLALAGYQLTLDEAQALLNYLAERPFKEVFQLVGLVTGRPVYETGE